MKYIILFLIITVFVLSFIFFIYALYCLSLSLFSLKKIQSIQQYLPKNKFAILIAARNEECVVGNLIESLKEQNYPNNLYDIIVIPNNCTDNTKQVAQKSGAKILECNKPVKSKGEVLSYALNDILLDDTYDAICVFDADNLVHQNFLLEMNNALCSGAKVCQGYRDSKNPYDSAISSCYSIYYWMVNRLYNHSRNAIGLSAMINGSGFCVSLDVIKKLGGWNTITMTEDIEFTTQCILNGDKVQWIPNAIIYDEQPLSFCQSWKQRKRWSTGVFQGFSAYSSRLLKSSFKNKSFGCFDMLMFFISPFIQFIYVALMIISVLLNFLYVKYPLFPKSELFYKFFISLDYSYIFSLVLVLFILIIERKSSIKLIKGIISYWLFLLTWIPINISCVIKKCNSWEEIKHTRGLKLSEIENHSMNVLLNFSKKKV